MVCIAAFIVLALIGVFVAIVSIFKPKVWKAYTAMLKKSWGCLWKKVRLQKCETGFREDVKNTLLSRVVLKHPKWVRPLEIVIDIVSVIIVVVAVWALITAVKSLLALWALGSCNVTKPSACSLGGEICSIDQSEPQSPVEWTGRWFEEWGEIFAAIPDKFRSHDLSGYDFGYITAGASADSAAADSLALAVDVFDPGCSVCMMSYRNQLESGFFEQYDVRLVPFPIEEADGSYKFKNSMLITQYLLAAEKFEKGLGDKILNPLFTGEDANGKQYQALFNNVYQEDEARTQLVEWLETAGKNEQEIAQINDLAASQEIMDEIEKNQQIVEQDLGIRGIPTIFYDGTKQTGLYKKG